jgi:hypothetical protein
MHLDAILVQLSDAIALPSTMDQPDHGMHKWIPAFPGGSQAGLPQSEFTIVSSKMQDRVDLCVIGARLEATTECPPR